MSAPAVSTLDLRVIETVLEMANGEEKMARLVGKLEEQFAEGAKLEKVIRKNLRGLGYGG